MVRADFPLIALTSLWLRRRYAGLRTICDSAIQGKCAQPRGSARNQGRNQGEVRRNQGKVIATGGKCGRADGESGASMILGASGVVGIVGTVVTGFGGGLELGCDCGLVLAPRSGWRHRSLGTDSGGSGLAASGAPGRYGASPDFPPVTADFPPVARTSHPLRSRKMS
jgi:hypothetical protein